MNPTRWLVLALLLLTGSAALAAPRLHPLIDAGGATAAPVTFGELAYLASGSLVLVYDYEDPSQPVLRYRTARQPVPGRIVGMARHRERLFVAWSTINSQSGVWIFSLSDPLRPAKLGELEILEATEGSGLLSIAVVGEHLYALDMEAGLRVTHIPEQGQPSGLAIALRDFPAVSDLHASEDRLIGSGSGLIPSFSVVHFDVREPDRPRVGASFRPTGNLGDFRFASDRNIGILFDRLEGSLAFTLLDFSDPAAIIERGRIEPPASVTDAFLAGPNLNLVDGNRLRVWDATNLDTIVERGIVQISFSKLQFAQSTSFGALLFDRTDRLFALTNEASGLPHVASAVSIPAGANPVDVALIDDAALLLHQSRGLGVHAPGDYVERARLQDIGLDGDFSQSFERIEVAGNLAVMSNWSQGLSTVDISNPEQPRALGRADFPFIGALALRDNIVFAGKATNGGELAIFDIADPEQPLLVNVVPTSQTFGLAIDGNLLYTAEGNFGGSPGMWVFDIADPAQPRVIARELGRCSGARSVAVDGARNLAVLGCSDGRMLVYDVLDPTQPRLVSTYLSAPGFNAIWSVQLTGTYALLGHDQGLDLIDLSNPENPDLVQRQGTPFFVMNVRVQGDSVFAFNALGGMREFRLTEEAIPGAGHTAAWFNPARDGEGWILEMLNDGRGLLYWFTYDERGAPRWLVGAGRVDGNRVEIPQLLAPSGGRFGPGFNPDDVVRPVVGSASLVFDDCNRGALTYSAFGQAQVIEAVKLSRTMRVDCNPPADDGDNDRALQSGSWFDPAFDGQGFSFQWLTSGDALVTWFTYDDAGNPFWMTGVGRTDGDEVVFPSLTATRGARFGLDFDAAEVERFDWGSLRLRFSCEEGSAEYASSLPGFGQGMFNLRRLGRLRGLECGAR